MPSMQDLMAQYAPQQQPSMQDLMSQYSPQQKSDFPMVGAIKDIGSNTLESLKNTATQTGQAISEPMNNPSVADWSQHPVMGPLDAAVRGVGKLGNALGGAYGAITSPITGAASASIENSGAIPAATSAIKSNLVPNDPRFTANIPPDAQHQIAMQGGGDIANAVMMGKAGEQGAINTGHAVPSAPYDPMQSVWDQLQKQSQNTAPRQSFLQSQSSDPNAAPSYSPEQIKAGAKQYYESSEAKGGMMTPDAVSRTISAASKNAGLQSEEGKVFAGNNIVTQTLSDLSQLQGKPLSLKGAGEVDDELQDRIGAAWRSGNDGQAIKLTKIRDTLRSAYTGATESDMVNSGGFNDWRVADNLWSAYRAGDDVQRIIENGEKADVPSTAIKNGFKTFVKNENNKAAFSDDEWAAAQHAAQTGIVTAALKTAGSKIISGVVGGTAGAIGGGGLPGGLAGAVAGEAVGYPFRAAANALQRGRGQNLIDMIGNRPEVHEAMGNLANLKTPEAPPIPQSSSSPMLALPAPQTTNYVNPAGQNVPLSEAGRESIGQSPNTLAEKTPAINAANNEYAERGAPGTLQREMGNKRMLGATNVAIPAAMGGTALAAQQIMDKKKSTPMPATGNIGDQNMQELQKLKPQSNNVQPNASDIFNKMQKAESGNNPNAKNPNSSASGAFQFTDSTWKQMVNRYGNETGIRLENKNDPKAQQVMAQLYAKDNIGQMQPFLKRLPTKGELYVAHVLGADGAVRLINAANSMPDKQAMLLFPKAVTAGNHNIFFNGNTPRTALQVYQILSQKVA